MVIGAHAADAELMGGAAVLTHHRLGWRSVLVHMTLGEKGSKTLSAEDYKAQKREEATRAAANSVHRSRSCPTSMASSRSMMRFSGRSPTSFASIGRT